MIALTGVLAVFTVLLAVPSSAAAKGSTDWRLGYTDDVDFNANVFASFNAAPYFMFTEVYDTLLNWDLPSAGPDLRNSPATKLDVSPDGLVYTYHLRQNLKWSDGKPLTADDVVWSFEHASLSNVNSGYVVSLKKAEQIDPLTVRITLSHPDARIRSAFVPILPKHIWGKVPKDQLTKFKPCCPMVGSGPFVVTKLDKQGTTILEPNRYFYGRKGSIKRILMIKYQSSESELRDIQLNHLDALLDTESSWVRIVHDPEVKVWNSPSEGFYELAFNSCPPKGSPTCTSPGKGVHVAVVQNPAIRHALAWAIDRENLVHTAYSNAASRGNGIISPFYDAKGYYKSWLGDPQVGYTYNPDKARRILADGGWRCPAGGVCEKDGTKAEFQLLVRTQSQEDQRAAQRIKAWARDVGIKIDLSIATEDALNARIYNATSSKAKADKGKYEPSYDAFMWDWFGDLPSPDYNFDVLTCSSFSTDSFYCNPKFDTYAKAALRATDFSNRVALLHQAERIELVDSPYIFLVHQHQIYLTRNDTWKNYVPSPGPTGFPFTVSWLQLQLIKPGTAASTNYAGAPAALIVLALGLALFVGIGWLRRRSEERQPLEQPAGGGRRS